MKGKVLMNTGKEFNLIEKNKFASCIPLISINKKDLLADVEAEVNNGCDFLEWRRDHFMKGENISQVEEFDILKEIKKRMTTQGLIYTYRSHLEGGVFQTSDAIREVGIQTAIESNLVDYIDVELDSDNAFLGRIISDLKSNKTQWIVSHHNFDKTPSAEEIENIYASMENSGGDVLKLAVMPHSPEDIRHLMKATLTHNESTEKPMIAIAMGVFGGITRIATELCGGSLTYAAGIGRTAPGQLSLEEITDLRKRMALI